MRAPLRPRLLGALLVLAALLAVGCSEAAPAIETRDDWGDLFAEAGVVGTFAMREVGADTTSVWNLERAEEARLPASTFKILNSLIILEAGVLPDVDAAVPWDGVDREIEVWNQDHTLRSGIEVSAVWMYQEMARQVGDRRMQEWVTAAEYGNADIGGGIDRFWLDGDLRISALEQLDFLEQLAERTLPFDRDVQDAVADILVREQGDGWTWAHKTGTALRTEPALGWLVGLTEYDGRTFVFALNLDLESVDGVGSQLDPQVRQTIARQILRQEGALP